MTNPYQPPQEPIADVPRTQTLVSGEYFGGYWMVTVIGIVGGLLVGAGIMAEMMLPFIPLPFLMPAIAWIGSFAALLLLLRGIHLDASIKVLAPILLAIPAYILYVPVCAFSAILTSTLIGSEPFPTEPGMVLASVVCFVGLLLLFAAGVRRRFKGPIDLEPSRAESIEREST